MPYNKTPEERLLLLEECRRAERILKLHWLVSRRKEVARFLAEVDGEIEGLKRELKGRRLSRREAEAARERVLGGPGVVGDAAAGG